MINGIQMRITTNLLEIAMGRSVGTGKRAGSVGYRGQKPYFSGSVTSISNHQLYSELNAKVQHHTFILHMSPLCFILCVLQKCFSICHSFWSAEQWHKQVLIPSLRGPWIQLSQKTNTIELHCFGSFHILLDFSILDRVELKTYHELCIFLTWFVPSDSH